MLLQRDPEACRRQAAGIAACVHAFVAVKPEGCTVIITGFILAHLSWKRNRDRPALLSSDMIFPVKLLTVFLIRCDFYDLILAAFPVENQNQTAVAFSSDTEKFPTARQNYLPPARMKNTIETESNTVSRTARLSPAGFHGSPAPRYPRFAPPEYDPRF